MPVTAITRDRLYSLWRSHFLKRSRTTMQQRLPVLQWSSSKHHGIRVDRRRHWRSLQSAAKTQERKLRQFTDWKRRHSCIDNVKTKRTRRRLSTPSRFCRSACWSPAWSSPSQSLCDMLDVPQTCSRKLDLANLLKVLRQTTQLPS